jgi:RNA 2',3'-cyclic 3'-phosphodiesterase
MFVAVVPPTRALEHLEDFLTPRRQSEPGFRWTTPEQWHLTLAFMADVAERRIDDLVDRLTRAAARRRPFSVAVTEGGAFPSVEKAKVVYAGLETDHVELGRLATGARAAVGRAGAEVAGGRFRPHVTIARTARPVEATRWVRVLDTYRGPSWQADEIALVASYLGEGVRRRPRYDVVETFSLGHGRPSMTTLDA